MIYKIKLDGKVLYYPGDRQAAVINPELDLQTGYAGELTLKVPPLNPLYGEIHNRKSMVSVYRGNTEIFYGEVRTREKDRFKNQPVKATGALSFLADSILPQQEWHDISPRDLLDAWLQLHNNQVEDRKKIYIGTVTIHDSNDPLYRITDRENTLEAIRDKLIDRLGGYLRLRHENDKLYLDWLTIQEYGKYCEQPIQFGENLMDYSETMTADDVITALIPLGAAIEQETDENASEFERLEKNVDITSVNDGKDYIYSKEAVENFGWVWRTEKWDDVSVPANLLKKATEFLTSNQYESLVISLTAVDLSLFGQDYDSFDIGDRVLCNAIPYGMKKVLPVMEMKIPLQQPDQAQLTLGENLQQSFTDQTTGTFTQIRQETTDAGRGQTEWMKSAIDNLTKKMTGAKGGYKLTEFDENGLWLRDLYMDAPDKNQATNILQINKNGIGGSHNGYAGPYTVGMILDGTILGERILAGSIKTEALSTECKNYIETKISDGDSENKKAILKEVTTSIDAMDGKINLSVSSLEQQLERKSGNWYGNYEPTSGNNPASAWTTDELRQEHERDLFFNTATGYAYQYQKNDSNEYGWVRVKDKDIEAAQSTAESALSKIEVQEGLITAEVSRAKGEEEKLRSAITVTETNILSTVSKTYTTTVQVEEKYKDAVKAGQTAAANAEANATKAGQDAADQAEKNAKADTDTKLLNYSTTLEMNSAINQAADSISLEVSKKVGQDEIISAINQTAESVKIKADHIELTGNVTISALSNDALNTIKGYSNKALTDAKNYTTQQLANVKPDTGNLLKGYDLTSSDISSFWDVSGSLAYNQSDPAGGNKAVRLLGSESDNFISANRSKNQGIYTPGRYRVTIWLKSNTSRTIQISLNRVTHSCSLTSSWKKFTFVQAVNSVSPDYQLFTIGGWGSIGSNAMVYIYKPEVTFEFGSEDYFNMLTDNGANQGLYLSGGKIYLNGEYLKSKSIKADKINVDDLRALSAAIGGWKIGNGYLGSTNDDVRLYSDGRIEIGSATMSSESRAFTVKYGLHVYSTTDTFNDGSGYIKFFNLYHVSSGGSLVFDRDGVTVAYLSSSSKRYKDHIADMTLNEAKKILDVPVIWYKYKENYLSPTDWLNGKKLPGFYAEDVYSIFPEAAQLDEKGKPEDWNFRILIPLMLKLIQNLYEEKEKTE